jgi:hypothetical protein
MSSACVRIVAFALVSTVLAGCAGGRSVTPVVPPTNPDSATAAPSALAWPTANPDPARYALEVRTFATAAAIDAQLLMAILYNENYKPHDPAFQRAWLSVNPDASLGIANMHRAAFDDAKRGRDFAGRPWEELPDDPSLAVEAAAWYLHDLARYIPRPHGGPYTDTDLLAIGYNAGPSTLTAAAHGARLTASVVTYVDELHANWATAEQALR